MLNYLPRQVQNTIVINNFTRRHPPLRWFSAGLQHVFGGSSTAFRTDMSQAIRDALILSRDYSQGHAIGDYYEFGPSRSSSLVDTFNHCQSLGLDEVQLFGLDNISQQNSTDSVKLPANRAHVIDGFFEHPYSESLRSLYPFRKAAAALFESSSYDHTRYSLGWLQPYLAHNTVLIFKHWHRDEYQSGLCQKSAFIEFLSQNKYFTARPLANFSEHGRSFTLQVQNG